MADPRLTRRAALGGGAALLAALAGGAGLTAQRGSGPPPPAPAPPSSPPTPPGPLVLEQVDPIAAALAWAPSFDDVRVSHYRIERDGSPVGTAPGDAVRFTDLGARPGQLHRYDLVAVDDDLNERRAPAPTTAQIPAGVFVEDFAEPAPLGWELDGLVWRAEPSPSGEGVMAGVSQGGASHGQLDLAGEYHLLAVEAVIRLDEQDDAVTVLKLRAGSDAPLGGVFVSPTGKIALRNDVTRQNVVGDTSIEPGAWHAVGLVVAIRGDASSLTVLFDGRPAPSLTLVNQPLGDAAVRRVQIGERSAGKRYALFFDRVALWTP